MLSGGSTRTRAEAVAAVWYNERSLLVHGPRPRRQAASRTRNETEILSMAGAVEKDTFHAMLREYYLSEQAASEIISAIEGPQVRKATHTCAQDELNFLMNLWVQVTAAEFYKLFV